MATYPTTYQQPNMPIANNPYEGQINKMLSGGFSGTPGYQWARDQGMQAVNRSSAARGQLGSGNVMTALNRFGTGLAQQDYGNQLDRLGRLSGQQQQYQLGQGQLNLGQGRLGLDTELGRGQLDLGQKRFGLDAELGRGKLALEGELGRGQLGQQRYATDVQRELGLGNLDQQRYSTDVNRDLGWGQLGQQRYATDLGFTKDMFGTMSNYDVAKEQNRLKALSDLLGYDVGITNARSSQDQNAALMLRSLVV